MVVSKYLTSTTPLVVNVTNFAGNGTAQVWQLNATNTISQLANLTYSKRLGADDGAHSQHHPAGSSAQFLAKPHLRRAEGRTDSSHFR